MGSRRLLLLAVVLSLLATSVPPATSQSVPVNETPEAWFVQFSRPALADLPRGATERQKAALARAIAVEKATFLDAMNRVGADIRVRRSFSTLFNGLSIEVPRSQLSKVARAPGVTGIWPVVTISLPPVTTSVANPELATALAMTGADIAQSELGLTGKNVRVAVMDTGIDYHHPDLGGCFGPGCRVFTGFDFVGDAFDASGPPAAQIPVPDPDPDDCNGHGTHVAGIIGASPATKEGVRGVAPGVRFGAYKVFGCTGSTFADIMIAAMERILADRMQVLNMSIGSAFQWPQYPTATASDRLVKAGVVVVASIGNNGANGLYSSSAPGVGSKVIGVASFDNTHVSALTFNVTPGGRQVPYLPLATTPDPPTSGTTPEIVFVGRGCRADPYLANPAGKVALIERGVCTFNEKYQRAADAGAVGVMIHNNVPGLFAGGGVISRGIFGVGISQADGLHLRSLTAPTATWTNVRINALNPTGGLISSFSSYGLSPDLAIKPDLGAPGGLIRSTLPLEQGGYGILSGTSMSSPHVAGAVALLLQARPRIAAGDVRDALLPTAAPKPWWGNPALGFLDNVHRQGAGMLQIDKAVRATTRLWPTALPLGENETGAPVTHRIWVMNGGSAAVTYRITHEGALATGPNTFSPAFFATFAGVAFSTTELTVPAGAKRFVDVTITPPAGLATRGLYGGYIVFTPVDGGQTYRVAYAGFKGDYQGFDVLTPTPFGFPWLARLVGTSFVRQGPGATFTFTGDDIAYVLFHLDHQASQVRLRAVAPTGRTHSLFRFDFVGRNSTATAFFVVPWDGRDSAGRPVPDGEYTLQLWVLKPLGQKHIPGHTQQWISPTFFIDRP